MLSDELLFTNDDKTDLEEELLAAWTVLVVDDEPEVHAVTRMVLADFVFEQRPVNIITASSAAEARDIVSKKRKQMMLDRLQRLIFRYVKHIFHAPAGSKVTHKVIVALNITVLV